MRGAPTIILFIFLAFELCAQCGTAASCEEIDSEHTLEVQYLDIENESSLQKSSLDICYGSEDLTYAFLNFSNYSGPAISTWVRLNIPDEGENLFITTKINNRFSQAEIFFLVILVVLS